MDLHTILAVILSGAIGISLGLLGGGGSILAVPVLVYVAGIEAKESVAMSLAIVGSTSLFGSLLHGRKGKLDLKVAATFGGAGIIGAYVGARLTHLVANSTLLLLFAGLMLVVAVAMLLRRDQHVSSETRMQKRSLALSLLVGLGVGVLTGFLGVGGGFLVVPALVLFAGLPMHLAVGTSLLVIAINSAAGFIGHMGEGQLHWSMTAAFTAAAVAGTFVGEHFARRVPAARLRRMFAYFVISVAIFLVAENSRALF
jgi:uncharacterized membrane protein YfcA